MRTRRGMSEMLVTITNKTLEIGYNIFYGMAGYRTFKILKAINVKQEKTITAQFNVPYDERGRLVVTATTENAEITVEDEWDITNKIAPPYANTGKNTVKFTFANGVWMIE